jgi:hypothetical protein
MVGHELCELQGPWVSKDDFIASLANGGPKHQMPIVATLTATVPAPTSNGPSNDQIAQVLELHDRGESDTAIARAVFKYGNTFYINKVRAILQQQRQRQQDVGENAPETIVDDNPVVVVVDFCDFCGRSVDDAPEGVTFASCAACGVGVCSDDADELGHCPDCAKGGDDD